MTMSRNIGRLNQSHHNNQVDGQARMEQLSRLLLKKSCTPRNSTKQSFVSTTVIPSRQKKPSSCRKGAKYACIRLTRYQQLAILNQFIESPRLGSLGPVSFRKRSHAETSLSTPALDIDMDSDDGKIVPGEDFPVQSVRSLELMEVQQMMSVCAKLRCRWEWRCSLD
jgi:hypothetical protein